MAEAKAERVFRRVASTLYGDADAAVPSSRDAVLEDLRHTFGRLPKSGTRTLLLSSARRYAQTLWKEKPWGVALQAQASKARKGGKAGKKSTGKGKGKGKGGIDVADVLGLDAACGCLDAMRGDIGAGADALAVWLDATTDAPAVLSDAPAASAATAAAAAAHVKLVGVVSEALALSSCRVASLKLLPKAYTKRVLPALRPLSCGGGEDNDEDEDEDGEGGGVVRRVPVTAAIASVHKDFAGHALGRLLELGLGLVSASVAAGAGGDAAALAALATVVGSLADVSTRAATLLMGSREQGQDMVVYAVLGSVSYQSLAERIVAGGFDTRRAPAQQSGSSGGAAIRGELGGVARHLAFLFGQFMSGMKGAMGVDAGSQTKSSPRHYVRLVRVARRLHTFCRTWRNVAAVGRGSERISAAARGDFTELRGFVDNVGASLPAPSVLVVSG